MKKIHIEVYKQYRIRKCLPLVPNRVLNTEIKDIKKL